MKVRTKGIKIGLFIGSSRKIFAKKHFTIGYVSRIDAASESFRYWYAPIKQKSINPAKTNRIRRILEMFPSF